MNTYKWVIAIAVIFFLCSQTTTADYFTEEEKTVNAAESLLQSTVLVTVYGGGGSGFYVSPSEIITNHHVVKDSKTVFIKKGDGRMCLAEVIFKQTYPDLALLKTECIGKPLIFANSVKPGQTVLAMGDPMFYEFYVSKGVVGLLQDGEVIHDAITDQGSSGGPVVNLNGQLVGVSQSISKSTRLSFAIDLKTLSYFLFQAKEG